MEPSRATSEVRFPASFRCAVCNEQRSGEPAKVISYGPVCRLCVHGVTREEGR